MAILTRSGRAAIAQAIKQMPVHVAIGLGDGAWTTTPPPENANATALMDEVGRRAATSVKFLVPDEDGPIEIATAGNFSESIDPTNLLLVTARFAFDEAPDEVIRELGVFVGTVTDPLLPPGQEYFTPDQVDDPGMLLELEHREPIYRSASTRETLEILIVF